MPYTSFAAHHRHRFRKHLAIRTAENIIPEHKWHATDIVIQITTKSTAKDEKNIFSFDGGIMRNAVSQG